MPDDRNVVLKILDPCFMGKDLAINRTFNVILLRILPFLLRFLLFLLRFLLFLLRFFRMFLCPLLDDCNKLFWFVCRDFAVNTHCGASFARIIVCAHCTTVVIAHSDFLLDEF